MSINQVGQSRPLEFSFKKKIFSGGLFTLTLSFKNHKINLMTSNEIRQKFLEYFKKLGHKEIPSASLVPEGDPTVLFTTAGMHPLVPFLLGEGHPLGKRLVNIQKCLRTDDIDEVGDTTHLTFFEMLGYWSLGDYLKEESIRYTFGFFTKELGLDKDKISVTVFEGDKNVAKDKETARIWEKGIGIPKERIYYLPASDNFWGPVGKTGPCGPCTEMFYDIGLPPCGNDCKPGCHCGKYIEIGNNVFMEYEKKLKVNEDEYEFVSLKQKNVDVGLGLERIAFLMQGKDNVFEADLFTNLISQIKELTARKEDLHSTRIIADHLRAITFVIADGVVPSNVEQGYILRRLVRRAIRHGRVLGFPDRFCSKLAQVVIDDYSQFYPELLIRKEKIFSELEREESKFNQTLNRGLSEFEKVLKRTKKNKISGLDAFHLYDTYGFPLEMTQELASEKGYGLDKEGFDKEFKKHQELSRKGAEKKFKGGLASGGGEETKYHTATHLLQQALRDVLGSHIEQRGSNITSERLRFDFSHPSKLSSEQIKKVEDIVNSKIKEGLPVTFEEMTPEEAKIKGAIGLFQEKYGKKVKVYKINNYSTEICGGPHVKNTKELGKFKIIKEESSSAGVRRIKAILE